MEINDYIKEQIKRIEEKCKVIKPLVVIWCTTYNHELYIRDALDSFIMQKTNFPFVAIVHEDASTDRTTEILQEYSDKYPDIILPIFEKENQYSKRDGSIAKIMHKAIEASGAKYIAMCEGDDYWIDRFKLQRQVDILDSDKKLLLVFHNALIKWENKNIPDKVMCSFSSGYFTIEEIFFKWQLPLASILFKTEILSSPIYSKLNSNFPGIGFNYFIAAAKLGKVYGVSECLSVYRKNDGGVSNTFTISHCLTINYTLANIAECKKAIKHETKERRYEISTAFSKYILHKDFTENKRILNIVWKYDKSGFMISLIRSPFYTINALLKKFLLIKSV